MSILMQLSNFISILIYLSSFTSTLMQLSSYHKHINIIEQLLDTISLPFTTPKLYLNFLFLVQFLPLFAFYSFNYTVKSRGVCNQLQYPAKILLYFVLYYYITIILYYCITIDSLTDLVTNSVSYFYFLHLYYVFIPPRFHRFRIKSLMQFHILQKLTL